MSARRTVLVLVAALVAWVAYALWSDRHGPVEVAGGTAGPLALTGSLPERGRYLAAAADCTACHSAPGGADYAGGVAFTLPVGTLYSSNLTPDPDTGIGRWSDDAFVVAVREGVAPGGRHLYPAHPYTSYAGLARDDVLAIRAYLATLPPVRQSTPAPDLAFPFSVRALLPLWNGLFRPATVGYRAAGAPDATARRGAYLAGPLGHCGECHTPRNALYALRGGAPLAGAVTGGWNAYAIDAPGLAHWTAADLDRYLATGRADGHGHAAGPMKAVVAFDTGVLTDEDRAALVAWLVAGRHGAATAPPTVAPVAPATTTGALLYAGACAGCHDGVPGVPSAGGSLDGARTAQDPRGTNLLRLLAAGSGHGDPAQAMPAFGGGTSDAERAALANHVLARFGGLTPALTAADAHRAATP